MKQAITISLKSYRSLLAPRVRTAHKGLFGHVLIVGGDYGMAGAVRLSAEAALRCGAGLVSVATRLEHITAILSGRPEIMAHGIIKAHDLETLLSKATIIVLGPGLGKTSWSYDLFHRVLSAPQKKVIDADGLNILAEHPQSFSDWVLTPHLGEASRLLSCDVHEIESNKIEAAEKLQKKYGGVCVLKDAGSLIASSEKMSLCEAGNPGMASGGMGDILTGVIAALLAQGATLSEAAECGVLLHATAGDIAAQQSGERGLLASDLLSFLHKLVNPVI